MSTTSDRSVVLAKPTTVAKLLAKGVSKKRALARAAMGSRKNRRKRRHGH